jgi:hypothetical protein
MMMMGDIVPYSISLQMVFMTVTFIPMAKSISVVGSTALKPQLFRIHFIFYFHEIVKYISSVFSAFLSK